MPSIKDLKKRIGSVKNTQQITKAMKMVSAAKLRRSQEAIQNQRPYAKRVADLIDLVSKLSTIDSDHPILKQREPTTGAKRILLLVVTSDRGLCGGFNSNAIKAAQRFIKAHPSDEVSLSFVGRKGFDFFKSRYAKQGPNFGEVGGKVAFAKAKEVADKLVSVYSEDQFDEIKIVYNEFKNAASQIVVVEDFLPLPAFADQDSEAAPADVPPMYIVKPSAGTLLTELVSKNFAIQLFRVLLESQASEHGARMSAMENATKNAGEMIRKLTLQYNKQRQAGITKELLEIIAGSESQKGA